MRIRWLVTLAIAALLLLDLYLPLSIIGRRGPEGAVRLEVPTSRVAVGQPFPPARLIDLDGEPFDLASLRGHRVLLTYERSVDW